MIDLHTGLGPWGYGELIGSGSSDSDWERLQRWYGPEVTRPGQGPSSSSVVSGSVPVFLRRLAPSLELTVLALEFGTRPIDAVLAALRADAWLHAVPDRPTPHREAIRRQVRDAFLIDSPAWRAAIVGRCADVVLRACRGLGGGERGGDQRCLRRSGLSTTYLRSSVFACVHADNIGARLN